MKKLLLIFTLLPALYLAQTIEECRLRFNSYLNFRGSLNSSVKFEDRVIYILYAGKKQLAFYEEELPVLAAFFENSTLKQQEQLLKVKGLKKLSPAELDSLKVRTDKRTGVLKLPDELPLKGFRIALDPGHFATTLEEAAYEQKFLHFVPAADKDTVKIFESFLTFNTATILKNKLEEQGAQVFLTRDQSNFTSFGCTYTDFIRLHKKRTLDSLMKQGVLLPAKYNSLLKANNYHFFWNFFRDYDLANRAEKINQFNPHVTVIIHYNVDEKNTGWKKHSPKNFTMAFIGGAFTADNLARSEGRINFVRLLLTDQLNRSQMLAQKTVANFNQQLKIRIATSTDADYLKNNCLTTASPGVFCRNLALCRKINSPLVYGESLYQDNQEETSRLMRSDVDLYGIKTNERLRTVADGYYEALMDFLRNN